MSSETPRTARDYQLAVERARKQAHEQQQPFCRENTDGCATLPLLMIGLVIALSGIGQPARADNPAQSLSPEAVVETPGWREWAAERGASADILTAIANAPLLAGLPHEEHEAMCESLAAQAFKESGYDADARGDRGKSRGMMQIQSCWDDDFKDWTGCRFDPDDPHHAALCACCILLYYDWQAGDELAQKLAYSKYNGAKRGVNRYARIVAALVRGIRHD